MREEESALLLDFMNETRRELSEIKKDVRRLIGFRMMLLGGSAVIAALTSTVLLIVFGR